MVKLASMQDIDVLFTDRTPPAPFDEVIAASGAECVVASIDTREQKT